MFMLVAHAGEEHATTSEAISHSFLETWYIALPLFIVLLCIVAAVTYELSKKSKPVTVNAVLVTLFVVGVAMYQKSAVVSVFALSLGFAIALLQVVLGLGQQPGKKKK